MAKRDLFGICPYVTSQKVLSGKWSIYLLYLLQEGPVRFNELQRKMPEDITHTTLSRQLKTLEEEGLIIRREYSQIPPKVEYSLSEIGKKFESVITALGEWGNDYLEFVKNKNTGKYIDGETT
ncbi:winged helix-turn-helix transcriptional regulator [Lacrimispora sp.]|uniref:winged helix-turn-helix transcriptional regulator n=1 Tax=Lacrimispora sp. TaxID=2719234 RepID=UPI003996387E